MWRNIFFILAVVGISTTAFADYKKLNKKGNEAYSKNDVEQALKLYQEADVEKPKEPILEYNIGTALYSQAKYEDAVKRLTRSLLIDDPAFQADAYYNMGNSFFRADRFPEAITAYKKSLEINPADAEAKYNLELARKKLKEQAQQQNQQQQQQQQKNEQNQEQQDQQQQQQSPQDNQEQQQQQQPKQPEQQDGEKKEQQGAGGEQPQQEQQPQAGEDEQQQGAGGEQPQQEQQPQAGEDEQQQGAAGEQGDKPEQGGEGGHDKMSKEDAQRLLQAIANGEKNVQKKMVRMKSRATDYPSGKDW